MWQRYRKRTIGLTVFTILMFSAFATAQSKGVVGDWTGNVVFNNNSLPLDLHISDAGGDSLTGTFDITQAKGIKIISISFEGNTLTFSIPTGQGSPPAELKGTLSADGNTIEGTVTQGSNSGTFKMTRGTRPIVYAKNPITVEQLAANWKGMADYTIELAELMPEEEYNYTPKEELRTWLKQCNHITGWNYFYAKALFDIPRLPRVTVTTKAEAIKHMKHSFNTIHEALKDSEDKDMLAVLPGGKTRFQTLLLMADHLTHTRGIMIMYLRMKDIAPPQFRSY